MIGVAVVLALVLLVGLGLLWAGGGKTIHESRGSGIIESIPDALVTAPAPAETLVVLSYNIAYGLGGQDDRPPPADVATVYDRLDRVIETIAASEADVALLQEVDFASRRTFEIDQLHYVAAALGWGFAARAVTWECRYLPWPLTRPAGRIRAGMGVLSRYPLVQNTRQRLPQPRRLSGLARLFLPHDTVQMVDVQCGRQTIRLLNVHLDRHSAVTRQRQAYELVAFAHRVKTPMSAIMGAFNTTLSDPAMAIITEGLRGQFRAVDPEGGTAPALDLGARLDQLLIGSSMRALDTRLMAVDEPVSDRLPVVTRLRWVVPLIINNGRSHLEHF
jgi:endonuclease/exonuclease/phosphatase family metal-dependent hydrolase